MDKFLMMSDDMNGTEYILVLFKSSLEIPCDAHLSSGFFDAKI